MDFSPGAQPIANHKWGIEKVRSCIFQLATKIPGFKSPCSSTGKTQALQGPGSATPSIILHHLQHRQDNPDAEDAEGKPLEMQRCFSSGGGGGDGGGKEEGGGDHDINAKFLLKRQYKTKLDGQLIQTQETFLYVPVTKCCALGPHDPRGVKKTKDQIGVCGP